nr:hypothetical protein [uncultured Agathobaculum sp.]
MRLAKIPRKNLNQIKTLPKAPEYIHARIVTEKAASGHAPTAVAMDGMPKHNKFV